MYFSFFPNYTSLSKTQTTPQISYVICRQTLIEWFIDTTIAVLKSIGFGFREDGDGKRYVKMEMGLGLELGLGLGKIERYWST